MNISLLLMTLILSYATPDLTQTQPAVQQCQVSNFIVLDTTRYQGQALLIAVPEILTHDTIEAITSLKNYLTLILWQHESETNIIQPGYVIKLDHIMGYGSIVIDGLEINCCAPLMLECTRQVRLDSEPICQSLMPFVQTEFPYVLRVYLISVLNQALEQEGTVRIKKTIPINEPEQ
ncbi:hypothetical protein KKF61_00505 [Patescibacteria group bacterium]|nr:hypothetical protein [Patescibacteria group bacterium]MBU0963485.1 hypothetical protein [Patescibacteria group bacterium]